jgi:Domain of unknown function (DUF4145)
MRRDRCPVCETLAETGRPVGRDAFQVRCPRCGPFILTGTAAAMLPSRLDADPRAVARTSHAIRSRTSEEDWLEIDSTLVDDLTTHPLPAPPRQLANLINWLRQQAGDGGLAPIDVTDRNALAAIAGASDADALEHLLRWAVKEDLVELSSDGKNATLTPGAWESGKKEAAATIGTRRTELKVETVKGNCPRCGPDRRADVVASHEESWDTEDGLIWAIDTYNILKCRGCETVYVQHQHVFSEDEDYEFSPGTGEYETVLHPKVTYWPAPARRRRPDWLDQLEDGTLRGLLDEVYGALDADHRVLAAIGARTALDRAMVLNGATDACGFAEKLDELKNAGLISQQEKDILIVLTDAGGAAAHRGWQPDAKKLSTIMDGAEAFIHRALVMSAAVAAMKEQVPKRPKRPNRSRANKKIS